MIWLGDNVYADTEDEGEMRRAYSSNMFVMRHAVLKMATINGAQALGRDASVGSLVPGKDANLAIVALTEEDPEDPPHHLLFHSDSKVVARRKWR